MTQSRTSLLGLVSLSKPVIVSATLLIITLNILFKVSAGNQLDQRKGRGADAHINPFSVK